VPLRRNKNISRLLVVTALYPRWRTFAGTGAEITVASGMSFDAKFDGEFANRSQTCTGVGTVRFALNAVTLGR